LTSSVFCDDKKVRSCRGPGPIFRISTDLAYELEAEGLSVKPRHTSIFYVLIPVLAVLTTLATGFWGLRGDGGLEYGLPLPWKTVEVVPICNGCPLSTSYDWGFFSLDAAFYAAIGYGIVLFYTWLVWKNQKQLENESKAHSTSLRSGR